MKNPDMLTREEFREKMISKAKSDHGFQKALIDNPHEAIGQLGLKILPDVKLKVVEESASVIYLVLPARVAGDVGCDGVGGCGFCQCVSKS